WLPDTAPEHREALSSMFANLHPDDQLDHDHPIPLVPGIGIPDHMFADAAPPPVAGGWDPAQTQDPAFAQGPQPIDPYTAPPAMQPGLGGMPAALVDQAAAPPSVSAMFNPENPNAIGSVRTESHAEQYSGDPLANPNEAERDAAAADLATHNPVKFAELDELHSKAAADHLATEVARAAADDRALIEAHQKNVKDAYDKAAQSGQALMKQVDEVMSRRIDPERMLRNRSTGTKLVDLIGAIAGGISVGQGVTKSNTYLDHLDRLVDQDIDAQRADIQNAQQGIGVKRGLLAEEYTRTGDLNQSTEATRLALKASALSQIQAQQQLYDPAGTRFFALGHAAADMQSRIAAGQQAYASKMFDQSIKLGEFRIKEAAEDRARLADEEKKRHDMALEAAKAAAAKGAGKAKPRPIVDPFPAWVAEKHITTAGDDAKRAYGEYVANQQRAQAVWDTTARSAGGSGTAQSVNATTQRTAGATPRIAPPVESSAAADATPEPKKYSDEDSWFEKNGPAVSDIEKKRYWFVDGNYGNNVPPVQLAAAVDGEKFIDKQRVRREMAEKADQLLLLTARLQKKGLWSKVQNKVNWAQDDDAMEARSLAEDLTGLAIQAKGMGVPSGNDVERIKTMMGGDPGGWRDPTPALQRARESMQIEQNADWRTAAPRAAEDAKYNKYRVLPTADAGWIKKVEGRGQVKTLGAEYANTDPKQLKPVTTAGDAPDEKTTKATGEYKANVGAGYRWMADSGYGASGDEDLGAAQLGTGSKSSAAPLPAELDGSADYKGLPAGADAYKQFRSQFVNSFQNLKKYEQTKDPAYWKAYQTNVKTMIDPLGEVVSTNGRLDDLIPRSKRMSWTSDPDLVAHVAGVVLRSGGK
ncbi:MAG: hypothetical protein QFE16_12315, partial [Pseudomonadota bacterium]|nr:hypothetical protein [Pseudomonadota bacterium]